MYERVKPNITETLANGSNYKFDQRKRNCLVSPERWLIYILVMNDDVA